MTSIPLLFARITTDRVTDWLITDGLTIIVVIIVVAILFAVFRTAVPHVIEATVRRQMAGRPEVETAKRAKTLVNVFVRTAEVVLFLAALLTILPELGVNIGALLAGVGIMGLAIGFGAQSLVRDLVSGFFILIENQFGIDDVVTVAGISGQVQEVNLRRTVLRDLDGTVHSIPNGEIRVASNLTREWSRVNMNVTVAYGEDLDKVIDVINRVGNALAEDVDFAPLIITPPQVLRVDKLGESGIEIKVLGETIPIRQWDVMGELRKRLKKAFDEEGIEIPFPHRVIVTRGAKATDV
ncbi:MAG TPA: mechanosensitive ion channel family protein [Dehalococcoidia bacterium]|nr:mechanosensitive ion channel family protein [Dehalococcoidia bacterium]